MMQFRLHNKKMNSPIKLQVLRKNFIQKHKLQEDYFTSVNTVEDTLFNDQEMFFPKTIQRKRQQQSQRPKCLTARHKQELIRQKIGEKEVREIKIRQPLIMAAQTINPEIHSNRATSMPMQPAFLKTTKIQHRRTISARQGRPATLPKYAVYLMKPCAVGQVKMQPRPGTAYELKNEQTNKFNGFGMSRKRAMSQQIKKKEVHWLEPWETEDEVFEV